MNENNLEFLVAKWVYDYQFTKNDMIEFAQEALEKGFVSDKLDDLVSSYATGEDFVSDSEIEIVLASIGFSIPNRHQAGLVLAKYVARKIYDGVISPNDGAQIIWNDICEEADNEDFPELADFCIGASNYDDISDDVAKDFYGSRKQKEMLANIESEIVVAAKFLLNC